MANMDSKPTRTRQAASSSSVTINPDARNSPPSSASPPLPSISLPKGGGAIRGIDEKLTINPVNGTASFTIPLASSPGRSGFGPQLSLSYDSGAGNGPFGFGWSLSIPSISRKTDKGLPRYQDHDDSDRFLMTGAEDLVPVLDDAGQRLVLPRVVHGLAYTVHPYRPRVEGLFARIERWTRLDTGISHWRSITRDNVTTLFGLDAQSTLADPHDPRRVFSYLIHMTFDDKGNTICYDYSIEDGAGVNPSLAHEANRTNTERQAQRYLKSIRYGNAQPYFPDWSADRAETPLPADWHFQLVLDYGEHRANAPTPRPNSAWPVRPDPFSTYRPGFELRTYRRCKRVLLFHHFPAEADVGVDCLVRSTDFHYSDELSPADPQNPVYTFLASLTQTGYRREGNGYEQRSQPPLEFFYSQPEISAEILTLADPDSRANLPEGLYGTRFHWVDLDGEGLPGILSEQDGSWGYKRNLSPLNQTRRSNGERIARARFGPLERVPTLPAWARLGTDQQLLDLSGGGQQALVSFAGPNPGFYKHCLESGWEPFRSFDRLPRLDWAQPNLRFVDLTGDGRADLLLTEDELFTFYPSLGEEGFGEAQRVPTAWDEQRGPRLVFADSAQTIALADMSGDGLSDLVRLRNGEVCYWPNLGYGRFGAKVSMDYAPRFSDQERFDPRRVLWADVDGSGTADLLYLGDDGVQLCFNRSGNSWAAPQRLAVFPTADTLSSLQVIDLLGNGTVCLVWSSSLPGEAALPLRYVDLMGSKKPHLLVRMRNNLGAETRLSYAPSTKFYLEDQRAGRPWITRLPFPVQVVDRVETYDWIGRSRFVSRYAYHHGYFDGAEREFRGFGMVEQWDTETQRDDLLFPDVTTINEDAASLVPPLLTRTWFHTGAFDEASKISRQYAHEYWVEPELRGRASADDSASRPMLLPDSMVPEGLTPAELRQAYRALKGLPLRIEHYARDGTPRAEHPYTITEQNFMLKRLQRLGPNQQAVFFSHPGETLTYHYERQLNDPRITHTLTLAVDDFGNVLRSVSLAYGRRTGYPAPEPQLSVDFQAMLAYDQTRLHATATEQLFTNALNGPADALSFDAYRAPLPAETILAELIGLMPGAQRFELNELEAYWAMLWSGAHDRAYEEIATADIDGMGIANGPGRRIVEHNRTVYRRDDLSDLLPLGALEPLALMGQTYRLALTNGLLQRLFNTRVTGSILREGGYVQFAGHAGWWIPTERLFFAANEHSTPAEERAEARAHFYRPRRIMDAFGASSQLTYDAYDLLPRSMTDALGNRTTADNDYRVLSPSGVTDPNGNREEVAFDCLGQVAGTAVMGKSGIGDSLAGFQPDLPAATILAVQENPLANPAALLNQATSRLIYDLFAYVRTRDTPEPAAPMVYSLTRETHASELAPAQTTGFYHNFSYSDGFGREIQQKEQAEAGPLSSAGDAVSPRWAGSGWIIYNNKGKPVRRYEPFFSQTHRFEFDRRIGVSSILCYDALERVVVTIYPDNSFEKTLFEAWRQETWDRNDTLLISDPRSDPALGDFFLRLFGPDPAAFRSWHDRRIDGVWGATTRERTANQDAARKAATHASTPTVVYVDPLGQTCLSVADNGSPAGTPERYATRTALDIEGKPLAIVDALGRRVMEYCLREPQPADAGFRYIAGYDMAGSQLYHNGMDGGERRTLNNVVGKILRSWDARGFVFRARYDALQRITHQFVERPGLGEILCECSLYGERHPDPERNLRGRLFRHYDSAGVAMTERYDFKGNLLESGRQLAVSYRQTPDWSVISQLVDAPMLDIAALDAASAPLLSSADRFTATSRFDALDRLIQVVTPHTSAGRPSVIQPIYNQAKLLERINLWIRRATRPDALLDPATADVHAVTAIDYDAHGRRTRGVHGNSTVTTYSYDPETFRLTTLTTTRPNADPNARTLQALSYTYDPMGNITRLQDTADLHNVVYFRNQRVEPTADYSYDALYRLISASGREHLGQTQGTLDPPRQVTDDDSFRTRPTASGDGNAMGTYSEIYRYDPLGNLLQMIHRVASGSWTRHYAYREQSRIIPDEQSNRLSATSLPGDHPDGPYSATYGYDQHGNLTHMPHLPAMSWDEQDRLRSTTRQSVNSGTPETTYYVYDATGQRVRKVTERRAPSGQIPRLKAERIYIGDFEIYREYKADGRSIALERESLHILDDKQRVALVETRVAGQDPAPARRIRYQHSNQLGSAVLELDDQAALISYEEYFPYGSTAYQATRSQIETPKRYRYTGKERDGESDLSYYGARYYAPWLARWISCDPAGTVDGHNLYLYVRANPVSYNDPTGQQSNGEDPRAKYIHPAPGAGPPASSGAERCNVLCHNPDQTRPTTYAEFFGPRLPLGPPQPPVDYAKAILIALLAASSTPGLVLAALLSVEGTANAPSSRTRLQKSLSTSDIVLDYALLFGPPVVLRGIGAAAKGAPKRTVSDPSAAGSAGSPEIIVGQIRGQRTVPATPGETARFEISRRANKEIGKSFDANNREISRDFGTARNTKVVTGPDVARTTHTHQDSGVALFSRGDVKVFRSGGYAPTAEHSVLGFKWPNANKFLAAEGLSIDPSVVRTFITQNLLTAPVRYQRLPNPAFRLRSRYFP